MWFQYILAFFLFLQYFFIHFFLLLYYINYVWIYFNSHFHFKRYLILVHWPIKLSSTRSILLPLLQLFPTIIIFFPFLFIPYSLLALFHRVSICQQRRLCRGANIKKVWSKLRWKEKNFECLKNTNTNEKTNKITNK